jgi:hypothetical protein
LLQLGQQGRIEVSGFLHPAILGRHFLPSHSLRRLYSESGSGDA